MSEGSAEAKGTAGAEQRPAGRLDDESSWIEAVIDLKNREAIQALKETFSPDGGAEREHNASPESLGFGAIHYSLITNLRPERALVIGSRFGYIPAVVALALKENDRGVLDFVDANYEDSTDGFGVSYGGVGHWSVKPEGPFEKFDLADQVLIHIMRSDEFFAACEASYGYVYIDGDHSYEGAKADLEESLKRLCSGGIVAMHDVLVEDQGFGTSRAYAELDPGRFEKLTIGVWPGLGLIRPKEE